MESKPIDPDKRHYYDASMSRRTRKRTPMLLLKGDPVIITVSSGHDEDKGRHDDHEEKEKDSGTRATNTNARVEDGEHNSEQPTMMMAKEGCDTNIVTTEVYQLSHKGRSSFGQHLNRGGGGGGKEEEKEDKEERDVGKGEGQVELVALIKHDAICIKRSKGMVSRCVGLLNHFVKIKPRRKHLLQLTM